jgi:hypothetical protein
MLKYSTMCCIVLKNVHNFVSPNNCNLFRKRNKELKAETGLEIS